MTARPPGEAYRHIAGAYNGMPNPMLALEARLVAPLLPPLAGLSVADIPAGTGRWAAHCRGQGARTVSLDICPPMLVQAPPHRVQGDSTQVPFRDGCFDLTLCAFGFGYAPSCLPELVRITRRGGIVIVSDVHPDGMRRGWRRSFPVAGGAIEAASQSYQLSDLRTPGLKLVRLLEAPFGEPERSIFQRAGKESVFEQIRDCPAVFVAQWVRV